MKPLKQDLARMPRLVRLICGTYDAWIVGGAANPEQRIIKDWDVAVPFSSWIHVANLIPKDAKPTLFGGWKFMSDGESVDVWPSEIMGIWKCLKCTWMWQPQMNIRIMRMIVAALLILFSCQSAFAETVNVNLLVDSIRQAENSYQHPYGIMRSYCLPGDPNGQCKKGCRQADFLQRKIQKRNAEALKEANRSIKEKK